MWALGGLCSTMNSLCLTVVPRGTRFVAKSASPALTALGSTTEEAAENARLMALKLLGMTKGSELSNECPTRLGEDT
jgi:hypothetical protein